MASIWKLFQPSHSERFTCCALTVQYIICSTVGQSIASISDLGEHIYLSASHLGKYDASVVYIGYGPPYRTIYITYTAHTVQWEHCYVPQGDSSCHMPLPSPTAPPGTPPADHTTQLQAIHYSIQPFHVEDVRTFLPSEVLNLQDPFQAALAPLAL